MFAFEDITNITGGNMLVPVLIVILAIVIIALAVMAIKFKSQQRRLMREEEMAREVARRRRIRISDKTEVFERDNYTCQICGISKDYLDSLCFGLGDYLLLEADHIRSVSQGGTGRDVDNLQCLCWRCNRKKGGRDPFPILGNHPICHFQSPLGSSW